MRGINAQKVYYKCILLLPVKYMSWSGSNKQTPENCVIMRFSGIYLSKGNALYQQKAIFRIFAVFSKPHKIFILSGLKTALLCAFLYVLKAKNDSKDFTL